MLLVTCHCTLVQVFLSSSFSINLLTVLRWCDLVMRKIVTVVRKIVIYNLMAIPYVMLVFTAITCISKSFHPVEHLRNCVRAVRNTFNLGKQSCFRNSFSIPNT